MNKTREELERLVKEGGSKSRDFWRIRKKILEKGKKEMYDTIDEEGEVIKNPEKAKEHIADYYENLYQAREGDPEYEVWTERINETIKNIEQELELAPKAEPVTEKEINTTVRNLKKGKSTGPDKIPNEAFTNATKQTLEIYRKAMNKIIETQEIPDQWQEGELIRIYKGKGTKGQCKNERGITLASNFGKVMERIINERAKQKVHVSDAQAGGKKGSATVDHILTLKEAIQSERNRKKPVYLVFLDVTKAYDKAWLDAIMYVMNKEGLKDNNWTIIKKMNEKLTAKINTKYGKTRKIKITDSIRQGGVLSVLQYALLMDEIAKEIAKTDLGVNIEVINKIIGCLLWMDDVVLISSIRKEIQEMLDIVNEISKRYHIEFGLEKSKAMKIGGKKDTNPFTLGNMTINFTDQYKYLGNIQNNKNNLKDQITEVKRKAEAAFQTVMTVAGNKTFKGIEMETIWKTLETCITSVITYGGETWKPNKGEMKSINQIMDNILKRILMVPTTTPREVLYIETGLLDIETILSKNRIGMEKRIKSGNNQFMKEIISNNQKGGWKEKTEQEKNKANITDQDMEGTKYVVKRSINNKIKEVFKNRIETEGKEKSKVKHLLDGIKEWTPGKRQKYMCKLTRHQTSIIFKTRTRMIEVKDNFRNKHNDNTCRGCGQTQETQKHVLEECTSIHSEEEIKVTGLEVFSESPEVLKRVSEKIRSIIEKLENSAAPQ